MNNENSNKTKEGSLTPQENHLSTEVEKESAKTFKGSIFQNHPLFFRWARRVFIVASLIIAFWLNYPRILALIKKFLPEGYSAFALILAIGIIALTVFSVWALWFIPKWQVAHIKKLKETSLLNAEGKPAQSLEDPSPDERFSLENEARKTLAQIIGGVFVLLGLFFTAENVRITQENADKTQKIADRGQVTDRFTKAIAQLGDKQMEVRLGGIYALEKIAKDYTGDYHWTVMEILTAFVRENAPNKNVSPGSARDVIQESSTRNQAYSKKAASEDIKNVPAKPATDIQAVLTVIGRRSLTFKNGEDQPLDLSNTNLRLINLYRADLRGTHFGEADLRGALLNGADLRGAHLGEALLSGADLSNCRNLIWEQIDSAFISENTKLPPQFETQKQEKLKRLREAQQNPAQ